MQLAAVRARCCPLQLAACWSYPSAHRAVLAYALPALDELLLVQRQPRAQLHLALGQPRALDVDVTAERLRVEPGCAEICLCADAGLAAARLAVVVDIARLPCRWAMRGARVVDAPRQLAGCGDAAPARSP